MLSKERYKVVMMVPTEAYIDVDNIKQAKDTMDWLQKQYPSVSLGDTEVSVRFISLEYVGDTEDDELQHSV